MRVKQKATPVEVKIILTFCILINCVILKTISLGVFNFGIFSLLR